METMMSAKMAAHVVSLAIERLYELLSNGTALHLPAGARDDAMALGAKLKQIRKILVSKSSVILGDRDEAKEQLHKSVTELAHEVCGVVDRCVFKQKAFRFRGSGVGAQIKSIRGKIEAVEMPEARREEAGTSAAGRDEGRGDRRDPSDVIVGMSEPASMLKSKLMEEDEELRFVSIVGEGGIGKTTLARHLFRDQHLAKQFDRRAWVYVSPNFSIRDVLHEMVVQVGFQGEYTRGGNTNRVLGRDHSEGLNRVRDLLKGWGEGVLTIVIRGVLEDKRYLVVVDDIWDCKIWEELKRALPNGKKGSKIMFTTRSATIAREVGGFVFEHMFLSESYSVQLVTLKVFGHGQSCPAEYNGVLREVAGLCQGWPLMVILVGGLLRTKSSLNEWEEVIHQLKTLRHHDGFHPMMMLCYNDLPWYLTPCFLYFSIFPENSEIPKQKLIRMWVAEGFIPRPRREVETIESVAEGYLQELVDRCLVQIVETNHAGVGFKSCQIHNLVQKLCLWAAEMSNFSINKHRFGDSISHNTHMTRIVIRDDYDLGLIQIAHPRMTSLIRHPHVTSLIGFFSRSYTNDATKLPREIGNLVNLRYLGLRGALICKLPSSIGNLRYLQTLDLRGNYVRSLPKTISKLTSLRHLLLPSVRSYRLSTPNWNRSLFRMDRLKNLHTLKFIEAKALIKCDAVVRLTNIRKLKVEFRSTQEAVAILASPIVEKNQLQSLHMSLLSKEAFPSLESLSRCHNLAKLGLHGRLNEDDLQWLPESLQKVMLWNSKMKRDPMAILEKMVHLKFLRLGKSSYKGAEMVCHHDGFPELKTLELVGLSKLRAWRVESGSMPNLTTLDLENTRINFPENLKLITSLSVLNLTDLRETDQVPTETSEDESEDEGIAGGENLNRVGQFTQSASFAWNLDNIPPGISVNLINAQIISAGG